MQPFQPRGWGRTSDMHVHRCPWRLSTQSDLCGRWCPRFKNAATQRTGSLFIATSDYCQCKLEASRWGDLPGGPSSSPIGALQCRIPTAEDTGSQGTHVVGQACTTVAERGNDPTSAAIKTLGLFVPVFLLPSGTSEQI